MEIEIDNMHIVNKLCHIMWAIPAMNRLISHKLMVKKEYSYQKPTFL